MLKRSRVLTALSAAGVGIALLASNQSAYAATAQGQANKAQADVVGVGSDTLQFAADFVADGYGVAGGYNTLGNKYRMINYDATLDSLGRALYNANGHAYYSDGNPTGAVVLRGGQKPVEDPDGSTAGVAALLADSPGSGTTYGQNGSTAGAPSGSIQYARASRIIKASEEATCATDSSGCGQLHPVAIGTDTLEMAVVATGTNAINLTAAQLKSVYSCAGTNTVGSVSGYFKWSDFGGGSSDVILPVVPQTGSGTRNDFLSNIGLGSSYSPPSCVAVGQEHDPQGILQQSNPADAIEPFSLARATLINSGYFANAGEAAGQISLENTGSFYSFTRNMYVVIREVDNGIVTPWQPGGTKNWAKQLFIGSTSYLASGPGQALVQDAGFVGGYVDCGANDSTSGACPAEG
ncbi:MAG TPA: hypothetical protein VIJ96_06905 [Acidothermaceae bacterium]